MKSLISYILLIYSVLWYDYLLRKWNLFEDLLVLPKSLVHLRKAPINAKMNIPTPHFLLRDPKSKKPTLISCHIRINRDRIIFSTGERILPAEWDTAKQRAINSKKYPHNTEINIWLDKVDSEIKSVFRSFNIDNVSPTPEVIKEKIYDKIFNKVNSKIPSLLNFIDSYIRECAKIKNPNTVRTYVTTFKHLQSYARLNKIYLDYTSITLNFYNSFVNYLMNDLQLSQNTIGKHIRKPSAICILFPWFVWDIFGLKTIRWKIRRGSNGKRRCYPW